MEELTKGEEDAIDAMISTQLRYSIIMERATNLNDKLTNLATENYDTLDDFMKNLETDFESITRDMKTARESIEDARKDMNLSDDKFIGTLDRIIKKERNPSNKIKMGLQYLNDMFNGGLEKGQIYKKTAHLYKN